VFQGGIKLPGSSSKKIIKEAKGGGRKSQGWIRPPKNDGIGGVEKVDSGSVPEKMPSKKEQKKAKLNHKRKKWGIFLDMEKAASRDPAEGREAEKGRIGGKAKSLAIRQKRGERGVAKGDQRSRPRTKA